VLCVACVVVVCCSSVCRGVVVCVLMCHVVCGGAGVWAFTSPLQRIFGSKIRLRFASIKSPCDHLQEKKKKEKEKERMLGM
jgi:hypothetical protein